MEVANFDIPSGNSRDEIVARDRIIKDFFAFWNSEHPEKEVWNKDLQDYIRIRFLSIEEISEKAARQYSSTLAVFRLTELLSEAHIIAEVDIKKGTKTKDSSLRC